MEYESKFSRAPSHAEKVRMFRESAGEQLRVAQSDSWAEEIFVDTNHDRFQKAILVLADYLECDGRTDDIQAAARTEAAEQILSLLEDSALDYFDGML